MAAFKVLSFGQNSIANIFAKCWSIQQRSISKLRIITELMGYPCEPKRPLNPYMRFLQKCRSELLQERITMKPSEFVRAVSKRWSTLPENDKVKYIREYEDEKSAFKTEMEKYKQTLSESEKKIIKNLSKEIKSSKTLKIPCVVSDKVKRELNKPKAPLQAFLRFTKKFNIRNGKSNAINMKYLSQEWQNLSDKEKEKYRAEFKKEYDEYTKNLEKWEENMLKEGKVQVIRLKTLKQMLQKKNVTNQ